MKTHIDTKTGAMILVAALILVSIGIFALMQSPTSQGPLQTLTGNPSVSFASQGEVASGFPKELILETQAKITESYSAGGQATAEWSSNSSIDALFNEYQNYFANNNWSILNEVSSPDNIRGIYASRGSFLANVAIVGQSDGSAQVTVSYAQQ